MGMTDNTVTISLSPVTTNDESFLLEAYTSTRLDEMALVDWSEAQKAQFLKSQFDAQQLHYRIHNPDAKHDVIVREGVRVGRVYVARRDNEIRVLDVTILPQYRNQGIGTRIIASLMAESSIAGKPLNIYVESYSPAMALFKRLGFTSAGTNGIQHLMEWRTSLTEAEANT
jgi:ribosomal protein S18 acetylase RimI-like enzyme